jgi:hypothetical protein
MAGRIGYYGGIVKDGLVLDLDAGKLESYPRTGTSWKDISGNNNNGTLIGGPAFDSGNGGSIVFDGTNDYVNLPHILNVSNSPITWNIWFKTNITTSGALFSDWSTSNWSFLLRILNGYFTIGMRNSLNADISDAQIPIYSLTSNVIYNICVTYNQLPNTLKTYVNGVLVDTRGNAVSPSTIKNSTNNFSIGLKQDTTTLLNGNVYNANMYNRALSSQEVLQNYNATKGRFGL